MKALSATLLAAQRSNSSRPYVRAVLRDYYGDGPRIRFQRWYSGSEPDGPTACVAAADGALVRARNDAGTLYVSRVPDPAPESTYSSWTSLQAVSATSGLALLRMPGGDLWLFYIASNDTTIEQRVSSDDGATWTTGQAIITAGGDKQHLAAASTPGGDVVLFWNEDATVYTSRWDGSSWGARTAWTRNVASVTGLAAGLDGDFQVIVAGTEAGTGHPKVWATRYGDGVALAAGTWGLLVTLTEASEGSPAGFSYPALQSFHGLWRLFFLEVFSGDAPYARVQYTTKPALFAFNVDQWREAVAFDYQGNPYALSACVISGHQLMLVASDGVWSAGPLPDLDVSADVLETSVDCDADSAHARIELDNSDGRYTQYGAGDLAVLQRGARLELSPGYVTGAGEETNTSREYAYWVESVELLTGPRARLVLDCRGAEWLLQRWRARRQYAFPAGTIPVSGLLFLVASRAGLVFGAAGNTSDAFDALTPAFTIHPSESGLTAVRRLIAMVPDALFFDAGALFATEPRANDAPQYAFGPGEHTIVSGHYRDLGPDINRARAIGAGVYGEAFDFPDIEAFGEAIGSAVDANLTTGAEAEDRAVTALREASLAARADTITIFGVHCGIEPHDVVEVTDVSAGLSAAPRRVRGYAWRFSTGASPRYDMTLTLGDV